MIEIQTDSLQAREPAPDDASGERLEALLPFFDAWEAFEAEWLSDGQLPVTLRDACHEAFNEAWPNGKEAALDAAKGIISRYCGNPIPRQPRAAEKVPVELLSRTFQVEHNPNCPSPWLVRLPGARGYIDKKPYGQVVGFGVVVSNHETQDALGFGKTLAEAARAAISAADLLRGVRPGT